MNHLFKTHLALLIHSLLYSIDSKKFTGRIEWREVKNSDIRSGNNIFPMSSFDPYYQIRGKKLGEQHIYNTPDQDNIVLCLLIVSDL